MKIGLVFDRRQDYLAQGYTSLETAEFDSDETLDVLERTIRSLGYDTEPVGNGRALCTRLGHGDRWDLVFNIAEGLAGRSREAQVPAMLELFGVPYTFSDPLVCALTLDKAMTKRVVRSAGLPTPRFAVVEGIADVEGVALEYPLFVKPIAEGTGKGVDGGSRVTSLHELRAACTRVLDECAQPVLVEEYLPGREFTTGLIGTGPASRVLGTMEVCLRPTCPHGDYSFLAKERCEEFVEYRPLQSGALREQVEALALATHRLLECRDAGRVDVRLDRSGQPSFLEMNPLPGLHPTHSDLPMIATQEGVSYPALVDTIIRSALDRVRMAGVGAVPAVAC
jgi:D-alanine-D-alanine ligase